MDKCPEIISAFTNKFVLSLLLKCVCIQVWTIVFESYLLVVISFAIRLVKTQCMINPCYANVFNMHHVWSESFTLAMKNNVHSMVTHTNHLSMSDKHIQVCNVNINSLLNYTLILNLVWHLKIVQWKMTILNIFVINKIQNIYEYKNMVKICIKKTDEV